MGGGYTNKGYKFDNNTLNFLKRVDEKGYGLGCRDMLTYGILKNNGLQNVSMTGCAVWYSDRNTESFDIKPFYQVKKIAISDPGNRMYDELLIKIYDMLKERYPEAFISIFCHRGINFCKNIMSKLNQRNVDVIDISNGVGGFEHYNEIDLHVGFRVHAHLYNLSIGNRSILIEEDLRGLGANESLGLPSIRAYSDRGTNNRYIRKLVHTAFGSGVNNVVDQQIEAYLDVLEENNYRNIKNAFLMQRDTYTTMQRYVLQLMNS